MYANQETDAVADRRVLAERARGVILVGMSPESVDQVSAACAKLR